MGSNYRKPNPETRNARRQIRIKPQLVTSESDEDGMDTDEHGAAEPQPQFFGLRREAKRHAAFGSNRQHGKRCRRCAPVFAALRPGRLPPQSKSLSSVREVTGLYYGFLPHLSRRNLMKAERGQKAQIIKRRGRGETRRFAEDFFPAFLCVLCVHPPQYCYGGRVLCVKIGFASAFFGTTGSTPINREQAPINSVSASTRQSRCRERAPKPFPVISPLVWSSSPIKSRILSLIRFITVRLC